MIPFLFLLALLLAMTSRTEVPAVAGLTDGAGHLLLDVLFRLALEALLTALLLLLRLVVRGGYYDSR